MAHSSRGVAAFGLRALRASGSALRGSASAAEPMLESAPATLPNVKDGKVSHPDLLNANMKKTQYAVRGELYLRAEELRRQGKEIIFTNVGNPQALGQIPLTFSRQVRHNYLAPRPLNPPRPLIRSILASAVLIWPLRNARNGSSGFR